MGAWRMKSKEKQNFGDPSDMKKIASILYLKKVGRRLTLDFLSFDTFLLLLLLLLPCMWSMFIFYI